MPRWICKLCGAESPPGIGYPVGLCGPLPAPAAGCPNPHVHTGVDVMRIEYVVVELRIVGNPAHWKMVYTADPIRHQTREAAIAAGIRRLGHDDFLIAQLVGSLLVTTAWQYDDRPEETEERADMAEQCGWEVS